MLPRGRTPWPPEATPAGADRPAALPVKWADQKSPARTPSPPAPAPLSPRRSSESKGEGKGKDGYKKGKPGKRKGKGKGKEQKVLA